MIETTLTKINNASTKNFSLRIVGALFAVTSSLAIALPVKALTLVTDRSALQANDSFNFGSLDRIFNPDAPPSPDSFLPNNFAATSEAGLGLNFNISPTTNPLLISPPFVFQTGSSVPTNFADGDFILFTGADFRTFPAVGNSGPITIDFATPVISAGTQIAVDDTFSFSANVSAFDRDGNLLDSFSELGSASLELDNSALFLGVTSEEANISRLVYSSLVADRAIGINNISIRRSTIPEPSNLVGLIAIAFSSIYCFSPHKRQLK